VGSVTIENLSKSFGAVRAVRDVSMEIPDGAFVTLLGPSGCGKTTTLNLVAGLETPDGGRIVIDGIDVTDFAPHERGMAMVFQSYALYPHKNVYGNLAFSLQLAKVPREEIERRVRAVAEMLEIGGLLERRVGQLSGGQQQRVSLARALVKEPSVFLFDEPLSNLDAALRVRTRNEIKKLHQQLRTTSIFVTHDQEEAMVLSDLVAVMKDGLVEQLGTPDEIYHRPRSVEVAAFVGKPRINLVPAELRQANGEWSLIGDGLRVTADAAALRLPATSSVGGPVHAGIRAEDVVVGWSESAGSGARARVALVEPLGSDTFLELESGSSTLTARVAASVRPSVGDPAFVSVRPESIHLFDTRTGERLNN
jgi:ABC-type sugar transport system ATPase subunit